MLCSLYTSSFWRNVDWFFAWLWSSVLRQWWTLWTQGSFLGWGGQTFQQNDDTFHCQRRTLPFKIIKWHTGGQNMQNDIRHFCHNNYTNLCNVAKGTLRVKWQWENLNQGSLTDKTMGQKVVFFTKAECIIVTNFYWNMCLKQSRLKDEKLTNYA